MQTQYQLLYRYINETTNTAITDEYDYVETKEFFNPDHKLYFTTEQLKDIGTSGSGKKASDLQFKFDNPSSTLLDEAAEEYVSSIVGEAEGERESIILGEMANANKSNNFYIYNGTTKEYHKKFMPETVGYLVANVAGVPQKQVPTGPDDYSKHFVMLGGTKLGVDAFLVCKSEYISAYNQEYTEENKDKEQMVLSGEKFANNLIFDWYNPQDSSYSPKYGEKPAVIKDVTTQTIDTLLSSNGYRIINLDGEDYLITEAVEYWCDVKFPLNHASTDRLGNTVFYYDYKYSGDIHESKLTTSGTAGKRVTFGTIFFNCGTKIPKEITFATEDGSALAEASSIMPTASQSNDGDKVLEAFTQYASTLKDVVIVNNQANGTTEATQRSMCMQGTSLHKKLNWYKGWKISDLEAADMGNFIASLIVTNGIKDPSSNKNITRYAIPAHYEPTGQAPYIIKDNYRKIPLSPWILHSIHNSLESGLNRAKELVSMVGINNVKLIKTVPFNQFIKIK